MSRPTVIDARPFGPGRLWRMPDSSDPMPALIDNMQRIQDWIDNFGDAAGGGIMQTAKLLGGVFVEAEIAASTQEGTEYDTRIEHPLGRVPTALVAVTDVHGKAGGVFGVPEGGDATLGHNEGPWSSSAVFLRSTATGTYQFVIV